MEGLIVTVVWTSATEEDLRILGAETGVHFLSRPTDAKAIELRIVEARNRGVVIVVVANDDEAGRAFRAGADCVLRAGECTAERVAEAIETGRESASSRIANLIGSTAGDLEPTAFSLLMRALCRQVSDSLTNAWSEYESISKHLRDVRELQTKLEEWAALAAPTQEFHRLHGRASLLFSENVGEMLESASGSLHRAETVLESAQILSASESPIPVDVSLVLEELVELLRGELSARASLRLRVSEPCCIRLPITFLVCLLTTIIAGISDAFRAASQWDGRIEIRVSASDGIVVIEVHDNGPALVEDLDSCPTGSATRVGQLARVRERVRMAGGELLVESTEAGTIARVYLTADSAHQSTPVFDVRPTVEVARRAKSRARSKT